MSAVTPAQQKALLTVVYRVAIHVRASVWHHRPVQSDELEALMTALHNIPLLLNTGEPGYWPTIRMDLEAYDERFARKESGLRLQQIFLDAGGTFPEEPP